MNCVVDQSISQSVRQGLSLSNIKSHLQEKYKLKIDDKTLKQRLKNLQIEPRG